MITGGTAFRGGRKASERCDFFVQALRRICLGLELGLAPQSYQNICSVYVPVFLACLTFRVALNAVPSTRTFGVKQYQPKKRRSVRASSVECGYEPCKNVRPDA
jgi:hypothetical protein